MTVGSWDASEQLLEYLPAWVLVLPSRTPVCELPRCSAMQTKAHGANPTGRLALTALQFSPKSMTLTKHRRFCHEDGV